MGALTLERSDADRRVPPSPPALRLRRPGLRDPRLLVGVVLVAVSVALGSWAVRAAGGTTGVLVAVAAVPPGTPVADAVEVRQVGLGTVGDVYLTPEDDLDGLVVVRTVGAGEMVPRTAVATTTDLGLRPVAVVPRGALPAAVVPGAVVDLWLVPDPDDADAADGDAGPRELVGGVTVTEVGEPRSALAVGGGTTVHVLVPVEDLPTVLAALAGDGAVEVVPVPGGAARR